MKLITQASGVGLFEEGSRLVVVDRRLNGHYFAGFVLSILVFILGINGMVQLLLAVGASGQSALLGLILVGLAIVFGSALLLVVRAIKRQNERVPTPQDATLIFDLESQQLLDGAGDVVAPLHKVKLVRRLQLGSAFRKLVAQVDGGTSLVVVRGNPFAGGFSSIEDELRKRTPIS
jgi:hypothetical protein